MRGNLHSAVANLLLTADCLAALGAFCGYRCARLFRAKHVPSDGQCRPYLHLRNQAANGRYDGIRAAYETSTASPSADSRADGTASVRVSFLYIQINIPIRLRGILRQRSRESADGSAQRGSCLPQFFRRRPSFQAAGRHFPSADRASPKF